MCNSHTSSTTTGHGCDATAMNRRSAVRIAGMAALAAPAFSLAASGPAAAVTNDPYYPSFGDWRYSVSHYDIGDTVIVNGQNTSVSGATTMTAKALAAMTDLEIDFALVPSGIWINGLRVPFTRLSWRKLRVTGFRLAAGASFKILVRYSDYPVIRQNQAWAAGAAHIAYGDGIMASGTMVSFFGEPNGAVYWYPCNDRLTNKALYNISVSTVQGHKIAGPGILSSRFTFTSNGRAMHNAKFVVNQPVHSWIPALHVGAMGQRSQYISVGGRSVWSTFTWPSTTVERYDLAAITERSLNYFASLYGPYPFDRAGGVQVQYNRLPYAGVDDYWAIENFGMPAYTPSALANPLQGFIAHENAHQWFGNSVTVTSWKDVVLIQEGLASLLQWDYLVTRGAAGSFPWTINPTTSASNPGTGASFFSTEVYGSATGIMQRLRYEMDGTIYQPGARRFTAFLAGLARDFRYGHVTRAQFKARAQAAAGKDLTAFWNTYKI